MSLFGESKSFPQSTWQTSAYDPLIISGSQGYPYLQGRLGAKYFALPDSLVEIDKGNENGNWVRLSVGSAVQVML